MSDPNVLGALGYLLERVACTANIYGKINDIKFGDSFRCDN